MWRNGKQLTTITYNGLPLRFVCMSERDIDDAKQQINAIANSLAKTNKVYWRRPITVWKDTQFETNMTYTYVTARLSFAAIKPYGLFTISRPYDNDNLLPSFGKLYDDASLSVQECGWACKCQDTCERTGERLY